MDNGIFGSAREKINCVVFINQPILRKNNESEQRIQILGNSNVLSILTI